MAFSILEKKDEERLYLNRFRELIGGEFPEGKVEDFEEPDFVITGSKRSVGIEITKLFWQPDPDKQPQQAIESVRDSVATRAQQLHLEAGLSPCLVSIHFLPRALFRRDAERVANAVVELVSDNIPAAAHESVRVPPNSWTEVERPLEIAAIHVLRLNLRDRTYYSAPQSGFVPTLQPERDLQPAINKKNEKTPAYRKNCDEIWLVINIGIGSISSIFDVDDTVLEYRFQSQFDRLFLFCQLTSQLWQLTPE